MNELELTGRARTHIVVLDQPRCAMHYGAVTSFLAMRDAAFAAGIDCGADSCFRDFDPPHAIWYCKCLWVRRLQYHGG